MSAPLRLYAHLDDEGVVRATWLVVRGDAMWLRVDVKDGDEVDPAAGAQELRVPLGAIEAIAKRYGKPLEGTFDESTLGERAAIYRKPEESEGLWLRVFRFRGFGSVHAADWIAIESEGGADTVAVPAPLFTASLSALSRAAADLHLRR